MNSQLDTFLQRLSHVAQVGLLALGVFGYFYTVVPVFQNQQLQEQAAKLELEKATAQRSLDELVRQRSQVSTELAVLRENFSKERTRNSVLASEVTSAREEEANAKRKAAEAEAGLAAHLKALEAARWELVIFDVSLALTFRSYNSIVSAAYQQADMDMSSTILEAEIGWPKPYALLFDAVKSAQERRQGDASIPTIFYEDLRSFIASRNTALACTLPDFQTLHASYQLQLAALEQSIDATTEASLKKLEEEHTSKGQRIRITDEYRQATRRTVRVGKMLSLNSSFRDKLNKPRTECADKAYKVLDEFREIRGIRS